MAVVMTRWLVLLLAVSTSSVAVARNEKWKLSGVGGQVVEKEMQRVVTTSEAGVVTAADVADGEGTTYQLQFIKMDPGTLFLPVQLHADMVFYVHTGRGKVTYLDEGRSQTTSIEVERGDVYNLEQGTIFYIHSYPSGMRERLRIYTIFTGDGIKAGDPLRPISEAYSNVSDLLQGFEVEVLRLAFGVPREVIEHIKLAKSPPSIIPYTPEEEEKKSNWRKDIVEALLGVRDPHFMNKKKKKKDKDKQSKSKTFNFYSGKPDVENCYGWSRAMTNEDLETLQGSNIGMFMVHLTTGCMMGPHWNPKATEIAIVTHGQGIVHIVCPSGPFDESRRGHQKEGGEVEGIKCKNSVFRVKEGDIFVVPRFHPMVQISFNNDSFVFVGFSTDMGQNHPQFLVGKQSVLQVIDKEILALSLGQNNSIAVQKLLSAQRDAVILACTSCAEDLEKKAEEQERERRTEEEMRRKEKEEEKKRREEQEWRREEEEREKREKEEEERERREKEEEEKREEEERARREKEEQEKRRKEEERARKEQEEEERRRKEEEERRREEEERTRKEQEEKERRKKEEMRRQEEEQEEEERRREEEEEKRREEDERTRKEQEEKERREEEGGGEEEPWRKEEKGRPWEEEEGGDWGEGQH